MTTHALIAYASILLVLPTAWTLYCTYCLVVNYLKASKLGLPIIIVPVTPESPLWIAFQTAFGNILRFFPFAATSFTRYCRLGWEFHDRHQTHARLGDAWMLVTPARNWLYVANAEAVTEIFGRGRDFINPAWMLGTFPGTDLSIDLISCKSPSAFSDQTYQQYAKSGFDSYLWMLTIDRLRARTGSDSESLRLLRSMSRRVPSFGASLCDRRVACWSHGPLEKRKALQQRRMTLGPWPCMSLPLLLSRSPTPSKALTGRC